VSTQRCRPDRRAGARVDTGDRRLATVGNPNYAAGGDQLRGIGADGDALDHPAARPVDPHDVSVARHRYPDVADRRGHAGGTVSHRHSLRHHATAVQAQQCAVVRCRDPAGARPAGNASGHRGERRGRARDIV
jgi:hypothetical protein